MPRAGQPRMRVIAGQAKGCKLVAPQGAVTRPTPARAREALLSSWQSQGALGFGFDAFAGSGAIGIEALSRGAPSVWFADESRAALAALAANLRGLPAELAARANVCPGSAGAALAKLGRLATATPGSGQFAGLRLGWVYADPPFAAGLYEPFLAACADSPAIDGATSLVLEHETALPPPQHPSWQLARSRAFGRVSLSFYRRRPQPV